MSSVYTKFVQILKADGGPPESESFVKVREQLRRDVARELKRRGLWDAPPSYFGISGSSWDDRDTLDELVQECCAFIFVQRLATLQKQLLIKSNIDGIVILNIRQHLSEIQRKNDPIGNRIFMQLRAAVLQAVEDEELHVLKGDKKVYNNTVLAFSLETRLAPSVTDLDDHVRAWNDELLPELITGRGHTVTGTIERLTTLVLALKQAGVEAFGFKGLLDPMKRDIRQRWEALWVDDVGELVPEAFEDGETTFTIKVASGEGDNLGLLHRCVSSLIDRLEARKRIKEDLWSLWLCLLGTPLNGTPSLPSNRKLGELLGIDRGRLPELFKFLRPLVETCRSGGLAAGALIRENQKTSRASEVHSSISVGRFTTLQVDDPAGSGGEHDD